MFRSTFFPYMIAISGAYQKSWSIKLGVNLNFEHCEYYLDLNLQVLWEQKVLLITHILFLSSSIYLTIKFDSSLLYQRFKSASGKVSHLIYYQFIENENILSLKLLRTKTWWFFTAPSLVCNL